MPAKTKIDIDNKGIRHEDYNTNSIEGNLGKWARLVGFLRVYPDIFYDLITPETGGIRLDLDQRIFLRTAVRFPRCYYTFSRGWGKSFLNIMALFHTAIFYPNIKLAVTAQTKENAAKIIKEKYDELLRFYPMLKEEICIQKCRFAKEDVVIEFNNGSTISNLANQQSSKGMRRHQGSLEEDNLMNEEIFLDAVEPIFNVPRRTIGKEGLVDPREMNGALRSYTTPGYRSSPAFFRCLNVYHNMLDCKGALFLGAGWQLGAFYGRGESVSSIMQKKANNTPTSFDMNYLSRWTGAQDNAFVDAGKFLDCRTLSKNEIKAQPDGEYILAVDIARSSSSSNNQTSIAVLRIIRLPNGRIKSINLVNLITITGIYNNTAQAIEIKKIKALYNAKVVVVDENGMGVFAIDTLCETQIDPATGLTLPCWDTMADDGRVPDSPNAERCVYGLFAQKCQNEIVTAFIDVVNSGQFRMLERRANADYDIQDTENYKTNILPYIQTDFFVDETLNLKVKHLNNGDLTLEKVVRKLDKDRVSSVIYGVWYIKRFMDRCEEVVESTDEDFVSQYAQWF